MSRKRVFRIRDAGYLGFVPVSLTLAMNSPTRSTISGGRSICSMIAAAAGSFSMQSSETGALLEDLHVPEPGGLHQVDVGLLVDRARQAADVCAHRSLDRFGEGLQHDRVGDHQPSAGPQDAEGLPEDLPLVGREVDDAVRDDDVDRGVGHREVLDLAEPELDVRVLALLRVLPRPREHLRRHVHADHPAVRADPVGREEAVEPGAASPGRARSRRVSGRRARWGCRTRGRGWPRPGRPAGLRPRTRPSG